MGLKKGDEYIESIRRRKINNYILGKKVENIAIRLCLKQL